MIECLRKIQLEYLEFLFLVVISDMAFNEATCKIPTVYCGTKSRPPATHPDYRMRYTRPGTRYQCLQKGFGGGIAKEQESSLPATSLRNIKYIGATHETNFRRSNIRTLTDLKRIQSRYTTPAALSRFLKTVLVKSNGSLDGRAYNMVLLYLHKQGKTNLPPCKRL